MTQVLIPEQQTKLGLLQKAVKAAKDNFLKNRSRDLVISLMEKVEETEKELEAFENSLITPEQIEAQKRFDAAKSAYDVALSALNTAKDELKAVGGKAKSSGTTGDHSRRLTYEDAQAIRKDYSEGMKIADICKKYGNSQSSVSYIVTYLQHKLHLGDTAFTPMINKIYPKKWKSSDGVIRSGAPFKEDNVKDVAEATKGYALID